MNADRHAARDLEILTAISEGRPLTQRLLAQRLGVALGLTNLCLKRLSRKGYIKVVGFGKKPSAGKRLKYLLTPKGIVEKTRLTYDHVSYALRLYSRARQTLRESLSLLPRDGGAKRVALYGTGEAAELAYLTLREAGLEPVAVFDGDAGGQFLGFPVRRLDEMDDGEFDSLIVATFDRPEAQVETLARRGVPIAKIVTLRRLAFTIAQDGTPA